MYIHTHILSLICDKMIVIFQKLDLSKAKETLGTWDSPNRCTKK